MESLEKIMGVGVGVMILNKKNKILLGKRNDDKEKASSLLDGAGTWTMPGGKVDFGDTVHQTAIKETKEETDLDILDLEIIGLNENLFENVYFFTVGFLARNWIGEVKTMEPEEITEWQWFDLDDLPENLYNPSKKLLNNYKSNEIFIKDNK